jgi:methionine synthase II (cobalamin-independent)
VQPHLKKCFRGVAQLNFTEDMAVTSVVSAQGEEVALCEVIDTTSARGQVEQWLQQLERAIKACVHKVSKTFGVPIHMCTILLSFHDIFNVLSDDREGTQSVPKGWWSQ